MGKYDDSTSSWVQSVEDWRLATRNVPTLPRGVTTRLQPSSIWASVHMRDASSAHRC